MKIEIIHSAKVRLSDIEDNSYFFHDAQVWFKSDDGYYYAVCHNGMDQRQFFDESETLVTPVKIESMVVRTL